MWFYHLVRTGALLLSLNPIITFKGSNRFCNSGYEDDTKWSTHDYRVDLLLFHSDINQLVRYYKGALIL